MVQARSLSQAARPPRGETSDLPLPQGGAPRGGALSKKILVGLCQRAHGNMAGRSQDWNHDPERMSSIDHKDWATADRTPVTMQLERA